MPTTTTARRRLATLWTGACVAAGIAISAMDTGETGAPVAQESIQSLVAVDHAVIGQAGTLLPDVDLTPDQARQVVSAADRVCDQLTLGVPMMEVTATLSAEQGLTDIEARDFANRVGTTHCGF